jgi:phosphoenolpyruvate carboxylase
MNGYLLSFKRDIRLLGTFLGRVIKDQEGIAFYKIVERLRLLSKNTLLDKNKSKIFSKISKEIKKLPPKQTFKDHQSFFSYLEFNESCRIIRCITKT